MAMELPDGKTARNIQEQVKFLTEKLKDLYARVNDLEVKIVKVDVLPEEGEFGTIYLLPVEDPEEGNYFEEYIYFDGEWELIGTTQIDLSGYVDLTSNQTISGQKIFRNFTVSADALYDSGLWNFKGWGGSGIDIDFIDTGKGIKIAPAVLEPTWGSSSNMDLGSASSKFKDLYLSGSVNFDTNIKIFKDQYGGIMFQNNANNYPLQVYSNAVYVSQDLLTAASKDLGSSTYKWKDLYLSGKLYFNSNYIYEASNVIKFYINTLDRFELTQNTFKPVYDGQLHLGASGQRIGDLYLSGNLSDGVNSVSVAQIASGLGGTYRHRLLLGKTGETFEVAVNLSSSTAITTLTQLNSIVANIEGSIAAHEISGSYEMVMLDQIDTSTQEIDYIDSQGVATATAIGVLTDVVTQL